MKNKLNLMTCQHVKKIVLITFITLITGLIIFGLIFRPQHQRNVTVASAETNTYTTHFESTTFNFNKNYYYYSFSFTPQNGTDPHCLFIGIENITHSNLVFVFDLKQLYSHDNQSRIECYTNNWSNQIKANLKDYEGQYYRIVKDIKNIYLYLDGNFEVNKPYTVSVYAYAGEEYYPYYIQGFIAGTQQGKEEGAGIAQYGIFQDANVDAVFTYNDNSVITLKSLTPQFISNGVYFEEIAKEYRKDDTLESAEITLNFKTPFVYLKNAPLIQKGDTVVYTIILTDIKGKKWEGEFNYSEANGNIPGQSVFDDNDILKMSPIAKATIFYGRASDTLLASQITQLNGNYYAGYTAGYNAGIGQNQVEIFQNGYDKGYKEGELNGYSNAVSEGISQQGIFTGAIAFLKLFFNLATDLFGTKIIGDITFGLIIIGLPAVGMILNLVMGFIKKLLGSRGDDQ